MESYRLRDPRGYRFPKIWTIFKLGVSFLSKSNTDFFNSKIQNYFKTAGIQVEGVSLLSVKLSVRQELRRFEGELQSEKIPAVIRFQKSGLFSKSRGCQTQRVSFLYLKLPLLSSLSQFEGVSSRPPPTPSRFLEFQKSGLFQNRGNFNWREFHFSP